MKLTQFLTRLVVMVFVCGLMVFGNVVPAIAANDIQKGMEQLPNIQTKAEDALKDATQPRPYGQEKISTEGLNEVQGTADYNKMYSGANADTPPAIEQVEKALEKVGGKVESAKDKAEATINSVNGKAKDIAKSIKDNFKS
jgi:L-lactate utilization protein LutB